MNNRCFNNFPRITVAVYFMYFESIEALRACSLSEKAFNIGIREF